MGLGRWHPAFQYRIPEVCRPSETRAENLSEAHGRKLRVCYPIFVAFIASEWTVKVTPWVLGARAWSMNNNFRARGALESLEVPRKEWLPCVCVCVCVCVSQFV